MLVKNIAKFNPTSKTTSKSIRYIDTSSVIDGFLINIQELSENIPTRAKREVLFNDILISSVRPNLNHNYFVKINYNNLIASTAFIHIRPNRDKVIPQFLYYFLTSKRNINLYTSIANNSQTTFPAFTKDVIENINIPAYTMMEQNHIVDTIGSIDDLIEQYSFLVVKLNTYAQLIFKYNILDKSLTKFDDYNFINIISSGISEFEDNKIYIDTASVSEDNIVSRDYIISYKERPSRANMKPIENSSWIAKLKDSPKYILINNYSKEYIEDFILSTGFLGIKSSNRYINNYIFTLISSKEFQERKNQISIGATMQGINNDSFKQILVPDLTLEESEQIGKSLDNIYEKIYNIKKRSLILKNIKKNLLEKFFQ